MQVLCDAKSNDWPTARRHHSAQSVGLVTWPELLTAFDKLWKASQKQFDRRKACVKSSEERSATDRQNKTHSSVAIEGLSSMASCAVLVYVCLCSDTQTETERVHLPKQFIGFSNVYIYGQMILKHKSWPGIAYSVIRQERDDWLHSDTRIDSTNRKLKITATHDKRLINDFWNASKVTASESK